ncbi:hypothetical protein NX722_08945 [Endozoicomonas gorgoniicola]|uniref:Transposase n=1 Tax=Endozoicomonas gorgoniicola TaxID=1234144 RepID=A0ABT3MTQ7_9GAMM|nr:hypothetical protein [Endozoicomonas gorgoniicola]MCW7552766.1 hypothetical protein [Endozoicomonas gorgoniicola]
MNEQDQWALQRLKLIPGSMISGQGCNQKIVRPKNPTDFVNNFLLSKRLGIQHQSYQVRLGKWREWRYHVSSESLQKMEHYFEQRANAHGLKQVSRVKGKVVKTESAGRTLERFGDWHFRRWQKRDNQQKAGIGLAGQESATDRARPQGKSWRTLPL